MHFANLISNFGLFLLLGAFIAVAGCQPSSADSLRSEQQSDDGAADATSNAEAEQSCCEKPDNDDSAVPPEVDLEEVQPVDGGIRLPNVSLVDQDGRNVHFPGDVIRDKIVAMNFIFTTCKGICPPMSANFAALRRKLGSRCGQDVVLISVSVDPTVDMPQRLNAWREQFGGGPGWTLLTGKKQDVDFLLKELEVFSADKNDHSPFILLGDPASDKWLRVHGLTAPEKLVEIIADLQSANVPGNPPQAAAKEDKAERPRDQPDVLSPARRYFGDVQLVNHHGDTMRLYSDLLKGKVVVINSFFSTCKGSCPVLMSGFAKIQDRFGDRLGRDLFMISITVDPIYDTPEKLAAYADGWKARDGWYFLTGDKANVDTALYKLGHYVENKESHSNIFIIGNEATGLWKKARGLSTAEEIFPLIEEVLNDKHP